VAEERSSSQPTWTREWEGGVILQEHIFFSSALIHLFIFIISFLELDIRASNEFV
jgi:hypothetical protein